MTNNEYVGKLSDEEIKWICDSLDIFYEQNPCHPNAIIRASIKNKLQTKFIEPESIELGDINNKFVETIKIQH